MHSPPPAVHGCTRSWAQPSHHSHKPWHLPKPAALHRCADSSRQNYPRAQLQTPGSPEQLHKQTMQNFLKAERGIQPSQSWRPQHLGRITGAARKISHPSAPSPHSAPTGGKLGFGFGQEKAESLRCVPATLWPPSQAIRRPCQQRR